jgi:hypothetical protein
MHCVVFVLLLNRQQRRHTTPRSSITDSTKLSEQSKQAKGLINQRLEMSHNFCEERRIPINQRVQHAGIKYAQKEPFGIKF